MSEHDFNDSEDLANELDDLDDEAGLSDDLDDIEGTDLEDEFASTTYDFGDEGLAEDDLDADPDTDALEKDLDSVDEVLEEELEEIDRSSADSHDTNSGIESAGGSPAKGGLLSTLAGKVAVGGIAFVVLIIVIVGFLLMSGGKSGTASPRNQPANDWGATGAAQATNEVPTFTVEPPEAPSTPVPPAPAPSQAVAAKEPPRAVADAIDRVNAGQATSRPSPPQTAHEPLRPGREAATLDNSTNAPIPSQPAAQPGMGTSVAPSAEVLEEMKEEIIATIRRELPRQTAKPADNQLQAELVLALTTLREEVSELRSEMDQKTEPTAEAGLRSGRSRLKGFNVIKTTSDGTMSVVKVPSGGINVYFEGEVFNLHGRTVRVTKIAEEGQLVLVEGDYFIDEVREPPPVRDVKPASVDSSSSRPKPASTEPERDNSVSTRGRSQQPVYDDPVSVVTPQGNIVLSPKAAPGWNLNAAMSQGFLVKDPRGEFRLVRRGDMIEGLGIVDGLDNDGGLRVGIYSIPRE